MNTQNIAPQLNKLTSSDKRADTSAYSSDSSEAFVALLQKAIAEKGSATAEAEGSTVKKGMGYVIAQLLSNDESGEGMMMLMAALSSKNTTGVDIVQRRVSSIMPSDQNTKKAAQAYQNAAPDTAPLTVSPMSYSSNAAGRSAQRYRSAIDKFNVENNRRYAVNQKGTGDTYCNLFVTDVTREMGAEIPHFIDKTNGRPLKSSKEPNATALTANRMNDWLNKYGPQYGWRKTTADAAQHYANQGKPSVTSWRNSFGHGHIQMVSPSRNGTYDQDRGVAIAQAGSKLINYGYIEDVYRTSNLKNIEYFVHD